MYIYLCCETGRHHTIHKFYLAEAEGRTEYSVHGLVAQEPGE